MKELHWWKSLAIEEKRKHSKVTFQKICELYKMLKF